MTREPRFERVKWARLVLGEHDGEDVPAEYNRDDRPARITIVDLGGAHWTAGPIEPVVARYREAHYTRRRIKFHVGDRGLELDVYVTHDRTDEDAAWVMLHRAFGGLGL